MMKTKQAAKLVKRVGDEPMTASDVVLILDRLYAGEMLFQALGSAPRIRQFYATLKKDPELRQQYADAQEVLADVLAGQVLAIASSEPDPQRARVWIDAIKWLSARLAPVKYSERLSVEHTIGGFIGEVLADVRRRKQEAIAMCEERRKERDAVEVKSAVGENN